MKRFFPEHECPGAKIIMDRNMNFCTYNGGYLKLYDQQVTSTREMRQVQKMTASGIMSAKFTPPSTLLDGISRKCVTPEGALNLTVITDQLKSVSGMATAQFTQMAGKLQKQRWTDNHVSLLVNLLRFAMLLKIQSSNNDTLNGKLGIYRDGHVSIDMDQWWPAGYTEEATFNTWPCGDDPENVPDITRVTDLVPNDDHDMVDLRGLTYTEASIVLMMLGKWSRRSRARLDYDLPMLTDQVGYRCGEDLSPLVNWVKGSEGGLMPAVPKWTQVWAALKAYVTQNRLMDQFSAALYITTLTAYQFVPATAESCVWLQFKWQINMPSFASLRGRLEMFNDDEAVLLSHRAINEWAYIENKIEKMNIMCLLVAQALQTGCAVRAMRRAFEVDPSDLFNSEATFYTAANFASAAVAEATRCEFPMAGMPGIYLNLGVRFDSPHDYEVLTRNEDEEGLDGYVTIEKTVGVPTETVVEMTEADFEGAEQQAAARKEIELHRKIGELKLEAGVSNDDLSPIEKAAIRHVALRTVTQNNLTALRAIIVEWIPMAGVPVLLMPLDCFPYPTPLSGAGVLKPELGTVTRQGFRVRPNIAWLAAHFYRLCGYDIDFRSGAELTSPMHYFSPNDANFVWPVLPASDSQDETFLINKQRSRERQFMSLPPITGSFFNKQILEFTFILTRRGVSRTYLEKQRDIADYGGSFNAVREMTVNVNNSETIKRFQGHITRDESGFRFVAPVQGGVIPNAPPKEDAHNAEGS